MMRLAPAFDEILGALPRDWTDLSLDLRIRDETRYVEAAISLVTCNAQPYSKSDWHWHILVAHEFGHAAAVPAVRTALTLLDDEGIEGELVLREVREGRVEITHSWGRPASAVEDFRRLRSQ